MENQIVNTDSYIITAHKIFYNFRLFQSCAIIGYENLPNDFRFSWGSMADDDKLYAKGELVWMELCNLDKVVNIMPNGRRRKDKLKNSIGDWIHHKTFQYKYEEIDNKPKWSIWRAQ